jgi:hypothetical protein
MVQLFRAVCQDRIMKHSIVGKLESIMDNRDPNANDNGYSNGPPPSSQHQDPISKTLAATSTATATMAEEARLTATRRAFWTYNELWATADMIHSAMLGFSRRLKTYVAVVKRVAERRRAAPQMQALTQTALSEEEEEEGKASLTPTATPVARRTIPWEMVWLETDHRKRKLRELLQHRSMATNKGGDVEMKDG